ncbi:MAG: chromosomal replication initiator protein DnaA [Verrucomicrobia bacterium]|nr:chromosomal replication initiator protein DnaA [Verrucomicrobiota bacterium]MBS0647042.1 chromosomal replication initiator protein DnaA [Verrucomicrobiota bacterium]
MKAWDEFLKRLDTELGTETVTKWLRPLKILRFDACNLYLEAPDSFKLTWFEEHIRHKVRDSLVNNNNKPIKIHIKLRDTETTDKTASKAKKPPTTPPPFSLDFDSVNEGVTFENYITSTSNLLAYKLLQEACISQPPPFNPIFLFGRAGTGKTHLLMATAHAMRQQGKKVIYARGETFTEHVVQAIRAGEMQTFRKAYRNVDALLIDDLEVFSRKNATQEEFFHTFNHLHVGGTLIVLTASCSPSELRFIEPRLTSRFEWGIVVPLQGLEREKLREVVVKKASQLQLTLCEETIDYLLDLFPHNLQTLIRAVEALVLRSHLNQGVSKRPSSSILNTEQIQHALRDLIEEEQKAVLTPAKIIKAVAEYYGILMDDILSKSQTRECAVPRQIAMHLCRQQLGLPFMKIGDIFSRDHSTVMASVKQIQKGLEVKNHEISQPVKGILHMLGQ